MYDIDNMSDYDKTLAVLKYMHSFFPLLIAEDILTSEFNIQSFIL